MQGFGDVPASVDFSWQDMGNAQADQQGTPNAGPNSTTPDASTQLAIRIAWVIVLLSLAILWGLGITFKKGGK